MISINPYPRKIPKINIEDLDYNINPKNSLYHIDIFISIFRSMPLTCFDDYLEAEYFSKEVLFSFYNLDWNQIPGDKLNLFVNCFSNLQEILIKHIYGLNSDNPLSIMARKSKRNKVNKLKHRVKHYLLSDICI